MNTLSGLKITTSTYEHISIDPDYTVDKVPALIGCQYFDVVRLGHGIDLFVDDEGAINGSPLNLWLTILAHTLGTAAALFGNAVALSSDDTTGDTLPLTAAQTALVIEALTRKPAPEIIDRLAETLAPLPHVVAYLRTM